MAKRKRVSKKSGGKLRKKDTVTVGDYNAVEIPRPELYTTMPPQAKERRPGQLTKEQLKDFFDKGFIILNDFIDHELLDKVREDIADQVNLLAEKLYKAGKIKNKHSDKGLENRLIYLEKEYPGIAILLHKSDYLSPAFRKLWSYDKLLNIVEQLIGPDISGHPVWNLRPKVPNNEQLTVPWHQDNAYFEPKANEIFVPTAWIPFLDTHKKNGCMQMISGGHRKGLTATHTCCAGGTWYVELSEEDMLKDLGADAKDAVTCEIPYGGVLLFSNSIPHRSLENVTDGIRWSVDLRWQKTGAASGSCGRGVVMRSAKNPDMKIDWSPIADLEEGRNAQQTKSLGVEYDEFEPIINGPWMKRWKIIHHNKHTRDYEGQSKS